METKFTASHHHHLCNTASPSQPIASLNWLVLSATVHCFTGCAIGEVLGMMLARAFGWNAAAAIAAAVVLAFVFGYSFTHIPLLRNDMPLAAAAPLALGADTVSTTVMESIDNGMIFIIPGRWMPVYRIHCSGAVWSCHFS